MTGALLGLTFRSLAAVVFTLTACWKVSNRLEFEASFVRLAPRPLRRASQLAVFPLAAVEVLLAGALLAGVRVATVALVAPVAGSALVVVFTVGLTLGGAGGCGCWTTPQGVSERTLKLAPILRNLVLLVALVGAAVCTPHGVRGVDFIAGLAPFSAGCVLALLVVESAQIAATFGRRPTHGVV